MGLTRSPDTCHTSQPCPLCLPWACCAALPPHLTCHSPRCLIQVSEFLTRYRPSACACCLLPSQGGSGKRSLKLVHVRTLRMADEVLALKASPDGRLLAVALLDATVKVRAPRLVLLHWQLPRS